MVVQRKERSAHVKPEINGLLDSIPPFWEMLECTERLLEVPHSLTVGGPHHDLLSRLPAVCQSLIPHLALQGMMSQAVDLLGYPVPGERLQGFDDAGV